MILFIIAHFARCNTEEGCSSSAAPAKEREQEKQASPAPLLNEQSGAADSKQDLDKCTGFLTEPLEFVICEQAL